MLQSLNSQHRPSIFPEKGQITTLLYRLQKAEHGDRHGVVSTPAKRRVSGLASGSAPSLNIRCYFWVLQNRDWGSEEKQIEVYTASWVTQTCLNAARSEERADHISVCYGSCTVNCQGTFTLVYLDDVIIFSRSIKEHLGPIKTVLGPLSRAG